MVNRFFRFVTDNSSLGGSDSPLRPAIPGGFLPQPRPNACWNSAKAGGAQGCCAERRKPAVGRLSAWPADFRPLLSARTCSGSSPAPAAGNEPSASQRTGFVPGATRTAEPGIAGSWQAFLKAPECPARNAEAPCSASFRGKLGFLAVTTGLPEALRWAALHLEHEDRLARAVPRDHPGTGV